MKTPSAGLGALPELIRKYRALGNIPEQELSHIGAVKLNCSTGFRVIPLGVYQQMRNFSFMLLNKSGPYYVYLSRNEKAQLNVFLHKNRGEITLDEIERKFTRIRKLIEDNIPPVYQLESDWEGRPIKLIDASAEERERWFFPTVDFILKFVSGTYFRDRREIGISYRAKKGEGASKIAIQPATAYDFRTFRQLAYRDGLLDPRVVREINYYQMTHFNFGKPEIGAWLLDSLAETAEELGMILVDVRHTELTYDKYSPANLPDIVKKPLWFTRYSEEDISKIIQDIMDNPKAAAGRILEILNYIFPEKGIICEVERKKLAADQENKNKRIDMLRGQLDALKVRGKDDWMSTMPAALFYQLGSAGLIEERKDFIIERLEALATMAPQALLHSQCAILAQIGMGDVPPGGVLRPVVERFYQIKIAALQRLSDWEVYNQFQPIEKRGRFGHPHAAEHPLKAQYFRLLREKYERGKMEAPRHPETTD